MNSQIVGFGVMSFMLIVASDIETTAPLAVAFSGIILLTATIAVGPVAFDRISKLVGGKSVALPQAPNAHIGGR